jgi:phosphate transport system protein
MQPDAGRQRFSDELEQLRLQVEVMGVRVDENLERMRRVLENGDEGLLSTAFAVDDQVDAMNVSLTERCYTLLLREGPMASDLRLIVSVVKVLNELERVGDLALRVVKRAPDHALLAAEPVILDVLQVMADDAVEQFRASLRAWAAADVDMAAEVAAGSRTLDMAWERVMEALVALRGPAAVPTAVAAFAVGRSVERIADHAAIVGARTRYLLTGELRYLAAEVR